MDTELATKPDNGGSLSVFGSDRAIVREMAERLKLMIANGKKLDTVEALALAQYSVATGLNPFLGECYYIPGKGAGPGIAGYRKGATEQLQSECRTAGEPSARFWCDYLETNGETKLSEGDIGVKVVLHDSLTKSQWEKSKLSAFIECIKAGVDKESAWEIAEKLAGQEPTWSAIGVVRQGENFGPDRFERYERACKRGEKLALKKRFTTLDYPEPKGFDSGAPIDAEFISIEEEIQAAITENAEPQERRSEAQLQAELGFD